MVELLRGHSGALGVMVVTSTALNDLLGDLLGDGAGGIEGCAESLASPDGAMELLRTGGGIDGRFPDGGGMEGRRVADGVETEGPGCSCTLDSSTSLVVDGGSPSLIAAAAVGLATVVSGTESAAWASEHVDRSEGDVSWWSGAADAFLGGLNNFRKPANGLFSSFFVCDGIRKGRALVLFASCGKSVLSSLPVEGLPYCM